MKYFAIALSILLFGCSYANEGSKPQLSIDTNQKITQTCGNDGVWLQVLGSGGPELTDKRASSGYLVWVGGKSRVLVDAGGGTAVNFEKAGGNFSDLDMILLSHLHVDHSADLPAYTKGSYFIKRTNDLPVVGPSGNKIMPSTTDYVDRLFKSSEGAYQYLGDFLPDEDSQTASYLIRAENYSKSILSADKAIKATATKVIHGPLPALAWRVDIGSESIVFSGDMASGGDEFQALLKEADTFVAHNAIPEGTTGIGRKLHMPPSVIGEYANEAEVGELILSHRMNRTLGSEENTEQFIRENFKDNVQFANDLDCFRIGKTD